MNSIIKKSTVTSTYEKETFVLKAKVRKTSSHCDESGYIYDLHLVHEKETRVVSVTYQELSMISIDLCARIKAQLELDARYLCGVWDAINVRFHCAAEELKCWALVHYESFCALLECIQEAIKLGICWTLDAASHLWVEFKLKVDAILCRLQQTASHILVKVTLAFHLLKLSVLAGWAKIKLGAYLAKCKLRAICEAFQVKFNFGVHKLKDVLKKIKCYLRSVYHHTVDKIHEICTWVKCVIKAFFGKIHHCKEYILTAVQRSCLEVLLPCMSAEIIAKVSICSEEVHQVVKPIMFENFNFCPSLWTSSKKTEIEVVKQILSWEDVTSLMRTVTFSSCKASEARIVKSTSQVTSYVLEQMATKNCGAKPYLVGFKDLHIQSQWVQSLNRVETVKRVQPKRCTYEESALASAAFASFSIDFEELISGHAIVGLLHQQVRSLTVVVKTGVKQTLSDELDFTVRKGLLELRQEELRSGSALQIEVEKYYREVVSNGHVQSIEHLERIKIEFVARSTKKVVRVTCPAPTRC